MKLLSKSTRSSGRIPSAQRLDYLVLRRLLLLFLPLAVLFSGVALYLYQSMVDSDLKQIRASETVSLDMGIGAGLSSITDELRSITYDLAILVSEDRFIDLVSKGAREDFKHIEGEWKEFSAIKKVFDQIRWIDSNGRERARINYNNGAPTVVPENQLQNKHDRYYFGETLRLNRGEFFISPLDLNIEAGEIELPIKPMIRISTRVFDRDGNSKGIVMLNYLAGGLLDKFSKIMSTANSQVWLVNREGYWLKGSSADLEWGFMYQRPTSSMAHHYPRAWEQILSRETGQFEDKFGLWTYAAVFPLLEGQKTSVETREKFASSLSEQESRDYFWKVVLFFPFAEYHAAASHLTNILVSSITIFLTFLLLGSWRFAVGWADREETRTKLAEAEFKYRTVADYTYDWESWADNSGKWVYCSPACERVTGYTAEEFIANPGLFLDIVHVDDQATVTDHIKHSEPGHKVSEHTFRIRHKDGSLRWIEHICQPVIDREGALRGRRASNREVTDRKRDEQLIIRASKDAETANRAKSTFLANMSHEIRTPMNAIIGLTHLMQRAKPTREQSDNLTKINISAGHLLSIINDVLDVSKIEAGKLVLEQSECHLGSILEQTMLLVTEQASARGLTIEVDQNNVPDRIVGDAIRLRQVLLNYLSNAIKFSERGTIFLSVRTLEDFDDEILVRFEVRDPGVGIAADKLGRVFESFEQADASTTREYGGTGLGLAISKHLALLMGGEVGVESELGHGSTFWFTARLGYGHASMSGQPAIEKENAEELLRSHYAGSRILLVEDNAINRDVSVALLSSMGLAVDTAKDGVEAIAMVSANAYELILMDVQMPKMDGLEATRVIRSSSNQSQLPILAMTANVFAEDRQACMEAGMDDFVAKPVEPNNLATTILKWLASR